MRLDSEVGATERIQGGSHSARDAGAVDYGATLLDEESARSPALSEGSGMQSRLFARYRRKREGELAEIRVQQTDSRYPERHRRGEHCRKADVETDEKHPLSVAHPCEKGRKLLDRSCRSPERGIEWIPHPHCRRGRQGLYRRTENDGRKVGRIGQRPVCWRRVWRPEMGAFP